MSGESAQAWSEGDDVRRLVPVFALAVAVIAAFADPPSEPAEATLGAIPVAAFALWAWTDKVPLLVLSLAVTIPVVFAQRSGELEALLFDASLLAFVVARWSPSLTTAAALGILTAASPVVAELTQDPGEILVGIWILGIGFPWAIGRTVARQVRLAEELDATRRELAEQAMLAERRRIARDFHDIVGHGLAAVMLQLTSARHVLRRDPDAAEEALRSAEHVGRRSMQELRRAVAALRAEGEAIPASSLPRAREITALIDDARAGGLAVESRIDGDLSRIPPSVGVAIYRIAQEGLANAARHSPDGHTVLGLEVGESQASLVIETSGAPVRDPGPGSERPGYGLIGMRERSNALGGELDAGPTGDGWKVSCRLPLSAGERNGER